LVALTALVVAGGAGAANADVSAPSPSNGFVVSGDAAGSPLSFTIQASGDPEGNSEGSTEGCDGVDPSSVSFDPLNDWDGASASGSVDVGASGVATFPANDPNFGFFPFKGMSPSGKFNCLSSGDVPVPNGKPSFTNCQVRITTDLISKNASDA